MRYRYGHPVQNKVFRHDKTSLSRRLRRLLKRCLVHRAFRAWAHSNTRNERNFGLVRKLFFGVVIQVIKLNAGFWMFITKTIARYAMLSRLTGLFYIGQSGHVPVHGHRWQSTLGSWSCASAWASLAVHIGQLVMCQ